jgi:hypothetical protein
MVAALCLYTVLKIKRNINDEEFCQKIEKKMNSLIILLSLLPCIAALATNSINVTFLGNGCRAGAFTPTGCRQRPDIFGNAIVQMSDKFLLLILLLVS